MKTLMFTALLGFAAHAQAAAPVAAIEGMLAKPDVMCGRFEQSKRLQGIRRPVASSGRFCVVKGSGVLWRTLKPFPATLKLTPDQIVQFNGDRVAMKLDASSEPAVRMINGVLFSLLGGDLGQLGTLFEADGSASGAAWQVQLKARQPALAKAIGTIRLEGGAYVQSIAMDDASGDKTAITFSGIESGRRAMTAEEAALFQ
jgi:hypothetical protein